MACFALGTACGREPRNDEVSAAAKALTVMDTAGRPRMFAADQDSSGSRLCFASVDSTLPAGALVTVVHAVFPQYATEGRLGQRSKSPCFPAPVGSVDSMEYAVDAPGDTIGRRGVPIVILGRLPAVQMRGDTVILAIEPGRRSWRFRTCASEEGIHTTAWSGVPLSSPRRWHAYYYLGYDVEPDCTAADYAPDTVAKH
ncbi:MAG TPA: hypothetical protein VN876_04300 [Gemmatimonadaceae bacterium]|nr:hypothetical protein [Gemmatimonadaceae bacterium]